MPNASFQFLRLVDVNKMLFITIIFKICDASIINFMYMFKIYLISQDFFVLRLYYFLLLTAFYSPDGRMSFDSLL